MPGMSVQSEANQVGFPPLMADQLASSPRQSSVRHLRALDRTIAGQRGELDLKRGFNVGKAATFDQHCRKLVCDHILDGRGAILQGPDFREKSEKLFSLC